MSTDLIRAISNLPLPDQLAFARKQMAAWERHIKKLRRLLIDGDEACRVGLDYEVVLEPRDWHSLRLEEAKKHLTPEQFEKVVNAVATTYVWTLPRGKPETKSPPETTEGEADEDEEDWC